MSVRRLPKIQVLKKFLLETDILDPPEIVLALQPFSKRDQLQRSLELQEIKGQGNSWTTKMLIGVFDVAVNHVLEAIIGWDLIVDGESLKCNEEEKRRPWFMKDLLWSAVIPESPAESQEGGLDPGDDEPEKLGEINFLWAHILKFCSNSGNFLKN